MKKLVSFVLGFLFVLSAQSVLLLHAEEPKKAPLLRDLPDYIWEYEPDESRSKVIHRSDLAINIPSTGVKYTKGGQISISANDIVDSDISVNFSLSFGFFSVNLTPSVSGKFRSMYKAGAFVVNIPDDGKYYTVRVYSKIRVIPIIAKRKLVGSSVWQEVRVDGANYEVERLWFDLEEV